MSEAPAGNEKEITEKKSLPLHELAYLAMLQASEKTARRLKALGEPMIVWEKGRIRRIPPDQL